MQTLEQLVSLVTAEELYAECLLALQGVGFVRKTGTGAGSINAAGVAAAAFSVRVKVVASGELGAGTFAVSTDGGTTYGGTLTIPLGGTYVVPSTGVTVAFLPSPAGTTDVSFIAGDIYAFELTVPTFEVTAWQPFSTGLTLVQLDAQAMENFAAAQQAIAKGGFLLTAKGPWLDLWLQNMYSLSRGGGSATVGNVVLTDAAGAGPFTIAAGDIWVSTPGGLRFNNITGGTLNQGSTLTLSFMAESKGSIYNVGATSISVLTTSLSGVTVNNPNPMGGSWITTAGSDGETDSQAQTRAMARWPGLGVGIPADIYLLWAKEASGGVVTRVKARASLTIPGQVDVLLAGNAGVVSGPTVAAVQAYVDERAALTSVPVAVSATGHTITVSGTLYVKAGNLTGAAAAVSQNMSALFYSGSDTDGEQLDGIPIEGTAYYTEVIEFLMRSPGSRNVVLTGPVADVVLSSNEVAVLAMNVVTNGTGNPATDLCIVEY